MVLPPHLHDFMSNFISLQNLEIIIMIDKEVTARATIYSVTPLQISTRNHCKFVAQIKCKSFSMLLVLCIWWQTHFNNQNILKPKTQNLILLLWFFFPHSVIRRKLSIRMISLPWLSVCPFQSYICVFVDRGSFSVVGVLSHWTAKNYTWTMW